MKPFMLSKAKKEKLQESIGYTFQNEALLIQALTHSSFANEQKRMGCVDYERLEFLGDAILETVTSTFLFHHFPDHKEGELTKLRSALVCENTLCVCARRLQLPEYLLLGKGEELQGGREKNSILCDVMESIIGAIFLDGKMESASAFIHRFVLVDIETAQMLYDAKTRLQEITQGNNAGVPRYEVESVTGPEHARTFTCAVYLNNEKKGVGSGKNKKQAEQEAAYQAILVLQEKV